MPFLEAARVALGLAPAGSMNGAHANDAEVLGARGGSRTPKGFRPLDPKSSASASFATLANVMAARVYRVSVLGAPACDRDVSQAAAPAQ